MSVVRSGDLDYACARIAAREGERPDAVAWGRVESARELQPMLDLIRASGTASWTAGIAADSEPHAVERALRRHWRSLAREVTQWMPARWQPAVGWFALFPDLPLHDALVRGEALPAWCAEDPECGAWIVRGKQVTHDASGSVAPPGATSAVWRAWLDTGRRRLPPSYAREAPRFDEWLRLLSQHAAAMRAAPPGDATLIVRALRDRLRVLRRRATLEATAAFVFLTESALDVARLRGEIMRRRLFPLLALAT